MKIQLEESKKLVRFISFSSNLKNIFKLTRDDQFTSTFLMRSLAYYRHCENSISRDKNEGSIIQKVNGCNKHKELVFYPYYLISSWSIYQEHGLQKLSQVFFKDGCIAIVSTAEKINKLIEANLKGLLGCNFNPNFFKNGIVEYYPESASEDKFGDDWLDKAPFWKPENFSEQKEYRFSYRTPVPSLDVGGCMETIIFYIRAKDYIEKIFILNDMGKQHKQYIQEFCIGAGVQCEEITS